MPVWWASSPARGDGEDHARHQGGPRPAAELPRRGVFLDLFGMAPRPAAAAADALRLLLRALGVADEQIPDDVPERASVYRSLLRDRQALVVLDNAGSEEQVRPLLPETAQAGR